MSSLAPNGKARRNAAPSDASMPGRLNGVRFCRLGFRDRDHNLVAAAIDPHIARFHRLGQRNDLFVFPDLREALAADGSVLPFLLPLGHADVHGPVVINLHIHVRRVHIRQVGSELVTILRSRKSNDEE